MDDWLSYRLSDLILFSPQAYFRMFAQYHARFFPFHAVLIASAAAVPFLAHRSPRAERLIAGILAFWWLWVAIAFHLDRYTTINPAARYFAVLFVIQALLLAWQCFRPGAPRPLPNTWPSAVLFLVAALVPLASRASGREWNQVELIATTPDPTAVATLAFVIAAGRKGLAIIPLAWCAIGGATLWALDSPEAWVPLLSGLYALVVFARAGRRVAPR